MSTWVVVLLVIIVILVLAAIGLVGLTQFKAGRFDHILGRRSNSSYRPPAPAPSGIRGWFNDFTHNFRNLRNKRTAGGAYESTSYTGGGQSSRRGFGPLDPDGAWDARVDHEADLAGGYYEEQELDDPGHGPYGGRGYGETGVAGIPETRGRSQDRHKIVDARYEEEMHGGQAATTNPFSDNNALRNASPRPVVDTSHGGTGHKKQHSMATSQNSADDSPTERRSMFRENV